MPFSLVAIRIGAVAVSAVGGVTAAWKMIKDKKRYEERREAYESAHIAYEEFVEATNGDLDDLHNRRVAGLDTLRQAADFLTRANVRDRDLGPNTEITPKQFGEIKNVVASLGDIVAKLGFSYVGSKAAGVGAAKRAYKVASAFGTTSTGTAISSLSGIAARNATLSWLGGGSLASGGGGISVGKTYLTIIKFAPLAIIPPIVAWTKAINQSNRVDEAIAKMDVYEADFGVHMARSTAFREFSREMSKAVSQVERALKDIMRLASPDKSEDIYRVACAAKALADLLDKDFERRFSERRSALEEFYALLRESVDGGDTARLQAALAGILGVIQENPLGDLEKFRENWADPDFTIEL